MDTIKNPFVGNSTRNRSAISNGSWLLEGVDHRSALGRRYRDLCMNIADDMGGASILSEPQKAMIRQLAAVMVECEKLQSAIVKGEDVDHEVLVRLTNLHARLSRDLKIKTKPKPKRTLQDHLRERA